MSEKVKNRYIKEKINVFKELRIPLSSEQIARMSACTSEIAIDNIAHCIIMQHSYDNRARRV